MFEGVSRKFQGCACAVGVSRVFPGCFQGISRLFQGVSRVFPGCFKGVKRMSHGNFKGD